MILPTYQYKFYSLSATDDRNYLFGFVNKEQEKSILHLSSFIAAVVLDKAHNLVRKGFPAGFAEMDMNVKGRAADVLHKVGFYQAGLDGIAQPVLGGLVNHLEWKQVFSFPAAFPRWCRRGQGVGQRWSCPRRDCLAQWLLSQKEYTAPIVIQQSVCQPRSYG